MKKHLIYSVFALLFLGFACSEGGESSNSGKPDGESPRKGTVEQPKEAEEFEGHPEEKDGKFGYIDYDENVLIEFQYDYAGYFEGELARVGKGEVEFGMLRDGLYGFINTKGEMIIDYEYRDARDFHEGLAAVTHGERDKYKILQNPAWGYINPKNEVIIELQYEDAEDFSEGLAAVREGDILNQRWKYIDASGAVKIPGPFLKADPFHGGAAPVAKNGKWGFINPKGDLILPYEYENYKKIKTLMGDGDDRYFGDDGWAILGKNDKWDFVDKSGKALTDFRYSDVGLFDEGMAKVKKGEKYGFINESGEEVIAPQYAKVWDFSRGKAKVWPTADGDAHYIDQKGNKVEK